MITHNQMVQFVAVVRNHSITKAAEELFIAQPAISATIKKIEKDLNINLFSYTNKQMCLTEEGEQVYKIICNILSLCEELATISEQGNITDRTIFFLAAPSIHQYITPHLQLLDVFPQYNFSFLDCNSLDDFYSFLQYKDNCLGLFHILDPYLDEVSSLFKDYRVENIISLQSCLMTSRKNTNKITTKDSLTFNDIQNLPLIYVKGTKHSIYEYLKDKTLHYSLEVTNAQFASPILEKKHNLYTLGHDLFQINFKNRLISIPITDLPHVNLIFIYKNSPQNENVFTRISNLLHNLYSRH